jgi:release factor glutamine methyltransferase
MLPRAVRHAISPLLFHLYVKPKLARTASVKMCGLTLTVPPTVFHPQLFFSSRLLADHLQNLDVQDAELLDMGTGSGLLALCAARRGARVAAADINPNAVACTEGNAAANGLQERVTVIQSDLFEGIAPQQRFDYIFWNPPFYPREADSVSGNAWYAGEGYLLLRRFADTAGGHLNPGGKIVIIFSSDMNVGAVLGFFTAVGLTPTPVGTYPKIFETFSIFHITQRING